MDKSITSGDQDKLTIQRGKLDSLVIYDVTEDELRELEKVSPASLFLNFSIFTLSMGIAFLIALLTTEIKSDRVFTTFLIITILGFLCGIILFILWKINSKSIKGLAEKIRGRISEDCSIYPNS